MRAKLVYLGLAIMLGTATAAAQQESKTPTVSDIYCSGMVTSEAVPHDTYLISGEQSNHKVTFAEGDFVFLNKGSEQGVKAGDEYMITRAVHEPLRFPWNRWQPTLLRAMGTAYADLGRVRVVNVHPKVSTAQVVFSCDYMQRGDIALAAAERPAPQFKQAAGKIDRFAPPSGNKLAMVVTTKNFNQLAGPGTIVYVNLGSAQGVKVGDYFRIFRYQGVRKETAYQTYGTAYRIYGFGSTPQAYHWDDLPREILGEGIVLRATPNAATVLITRSLREIYTGDYVEIE